MKIPTKGYFAYRLSSSKNWKPVPVVAVDSVVKSEKGIVLIKRKFNPFKGFWSLPGGFVDFKEKVEDAVIRETLEETGLKVKIKNFVGVFDIVDRDPRWHVISLAYLAEIIGGKLKAGEEVEEVKEFEKLPEKIGFDHKLILKKAGIKI